MDQKNTNSTTFEPSSQLDDLFPSILQCFGLIFCGYIAGRLHLITGPERKGLSEFVGKFALPGLTFICLAKLEFGSVNWPFLSCLLASKTLMCVAAVALTLLVRRPLNFARAGLVGILVTQSNDIAIGVPIVRSLYGETHPDYENYLYLMAPVNLAFLNPICIGLVEFSRFYGSGADGDGGVVGRRWVIVRSVIGKAATNPVVFMSLLGIFWNFIFDRNMPAILDKFFNTLKDAFAGTALFLLGLTMVGNKMHKQKLIAPAILVLAKLLIFPLMTREIVSIVKPGYNDTENRDLSTFGFLYGTFPSANLVFILAIQYGIDVDLMSNSVIACVFLSGPVMYISAKMITISDLNEKTYIDGLNQFAFDLSIVGLFASVWAFFVLFVTKRYRKIPHRVTACLVFSQILICVGGILLNTLDSTVSWQAYLQYMTFTVGDMSTKLWATFLAVTLLLLDCRSPCFALKWQPLFMIGAWGFPVISVTALILSGWHHPNPYPNVSESFSFEKMHSVIYVCILVMCLIVTIGCLVLHQRHQKRNQPYDALAAAATEQRTTNGGTPLRSNRKSYGSLPPIGEEGQVTDIEDLMGRYAENGDHGDEASLLQPCSSVNCQRVSNGGCPNDVPSNNDVDLIEEEAELHDPQVLRHVLLILSLVCSMFVSLTKHVWTLMLASFTGVFCELSFLDVALICGQSIVIVVIFGLDGRNLLPLLRFWRSLLGKTNAPLHLPDQQDLDAQTKRICESFRHHHLVNCKADISQTIRYRTSVYRAVFEGSSLVDWLVEFGLAPDRESAVVYGRQLLDGRVLKHVKGMYHFYDRNLLYTFT